MEAEKKIHASAKSVAPANRGWMSEKYLPQADQVKCFFLTSPFIEPARDELISSKPARYGIRILRARSAKSQVLSLLDTVPAVVFWDLPEVLSHWCSLGGFSVPQINRDFSATYAGMSDDELLRIAGDKASLVDDAAASLETALRNRGISVADRTPAVALSATAEVKPEKQPPKSPRWLRGLIFAGWCIASIIFLALVFTPRMNPDAVEKFTEAVTTMCLKGSLGLWVLTELLGARNLTVKGVLIISAAIYVVGIGAFSLYLLLGA